MITMRDERSKLILKILCRDLNPKDKVMIEIGSYAGESTGIFAQYFKVVWAIDPWLVGMDIGAGNANPDAKYIIDASVEKRFNLVADIYPNIKKIKDFDYNVVSEFKDDSIDFIYIDAIHTKEEVKRQLQAWLPKLNETGVIGGHDYSNYYPEVMDAVNETIGWPDKVYTDGGNSWTKCRYINF